MRTYLDLSTFPVTCPVCGEKLPQITREHAMSHGYRSLAEFKEACGINYTTLLQRSREKLKELYNYDPTRWGLVIWTDTGECRYVTKRYVEDYDAARARGLRSANRFPLDDTAFNRHLSGRNPLAIFARGTHSRYFGFDVDTKEMAVHHALRIIHALQDEGIPKRYIHVSFSGGKGYHIELFTNKHVLFEHWVAFGAYILDAAGLNGEAIEFRPNKGNSHAWKLPLTFHHKTGNFAAFCDIDTLEPLEILESHDYLHQIEQMDVNLLFPILTRARQLEQEIERRREQERAAKRAQERKKKEAIKVTDKRVFQTDEEKRATAKRHLQHGLVAQGTRWNATRDIALYLYHENGMGVEEIREQLIEWTATQIERGMAATPLEQCIKEIDGILDWLPKTDGFYSTVRDITITREEIEFVLSVPQRLARDLLWALLLRSKAYAKRDGTFYTSDRDLQKLLCEPRPMSRAAISKWRRWLADNGYIIAIVPEKRFENGLATTYKLLFKPTENPEVIDAVTFDDNMDCRLLLRRIAAKLYTDKELKKMKLA